MKNEFARMDDKVHCLSQSNQTFTCRCDFKLLTAMPSSPSPHQTNSLSPTATTPASYSTTMAPPCLSPPITRASGGGNLQLVIKSSNPGRAFHFLGVTHNDYFFRSGLEELIQHLTENYRNRYGTPLASKFDVEGLGLRKVVSFSFPQVATMCKERLHEIVNEEMDHAHENLEWKLTMKNEFARMDDKVHCLSQSNQTFTCRCDFKLLTVMSSSPSPHQTNSLSPTATAPTSYSTIMAPPCLSPPITRIRLTTDTKVKHKKMLDT
ncbi:hypothetical protein JHK87_019282 [Glycine soja]|nr:hypothetical protein JHK87_019282 [Glycine soja]